MTTFYKFIASLVICFCGIVTYPTHSVGQETTVDLYKQKIKPLLKERCFACHGALKQESELRVDTIAAMRDYGILEDDLLLDRLASKDDSERMPPEGEPLSEQEVLDIKNWIANGAPAPDNEQAEADPMQHWAFQRIERPIVPDLGAPNPVDAFLSQPQQANGFKPQATAERSLSSSLVLSTPDCCAAFFALARSIAA